MVLVVALMCWALVGMVLSYLVSTPQFGMSLLGLDAAGERERALLEQSNAEAGLVEPTGLYPGADEQARVEQVARVLPSSQLIAVVAEVTAVAGGLVIILWLGESWLTVALSVVAAAVMCGAGLTVLFGLTLARLTEQAQADEVDGADEVAQADPNQPAARAMRPEAEPDEDGGHERAH